jgi:general secretion pathway protein D
MPHTAPSVEPPRPRCVLALAALAASGLALGQQAPPAPPRPTATNQVPQENPNTQRITPNFKDADITQIIEAVAMATHKNFIIDPRVRAQVTMLSFTPMTPAQFYQAFLAILQVHGFVAIKAGDVIKIVPDVNMRQYPGEDLPGSVSPSSDEVVTQIVAVKNVSAAQLVPVLRPLMPQNAQLSAVTGANILIMSDHASNVNRMLRIIDRIDQVGSSNFDVVTLQSATAADTARVLNSILAQSGEAATGLKIVADDRSNSIIVSGDEYARLRVRALLTHLDTPVDTGSETRVRYLRYSDATDLASRLKEQVGGTTQSGAARGPNGQPLPNAQGNTGPLPTAPAAAAPGAAGGPATLTLAGGTATIWADKDTNALVITAGQRTMRALNAVIDKLDIRRPQVLVQAIIADVAADKTDDLGINWALDGSATNVGVSGFISPVAGNSIVNLYEDAVTPSNISSSPPTGAVLGVGRLKATGTNFAAVLLALQGDARTNIIATPSVVTRDNQEAKMEVAQEVPFLTGQYTTTNGTGSAFQTIQQEDVGTILTVTPTINEGNVILLKLDVENSSLSSSSGVGNNPITNKNTITTNVLIKDGGTLVLGGLIQDSVTNSQQSVPFLGNIPILGELFRTRNNTKTKTDFLIFLQPRILRDDDEATIETDAKYNYMRREQQAVMKDSTHLPLAPYEPADPLPAINDGRFQDSQSPFVLTSPTSTTESVPDSGPVSVPLTAPATPAPAPVAPPSSNQVPQTTPLAPAGAPP